MSIYRQKMVLKLFRSDILSNMGNAGWGLFFTVLVTAFVGEELIHGVFFAVGRVARATWRFATTR
jgi:hypothetical protein